MINIEYKITKTNSRREPLQPGWQLRLWNTKLWKTFTSQKWIISIYKRSFLILSFNWMKSSQSLFLLCHFYALCSQQKNLSKNDIDRPGFLPFCGCYENYKNILQIIFHFGELVNIVHNGWWHKIFAYLLHFLNKITEFLPSPVGRQ